MLSNISKRISGTLSKLTGNLKSNKTENLSEKQAEKLFDKFTRWVLFFYFSTKEKEIKKFENNIINFIIKYKKNLNEIKNKNNDNLLVVDYGGNRLFILELLLQNGLNPNNLNNSLENSLFYVYSIDVCRLLLDYGANINNRNILGETPIIKFMKNDIYSFNRRHLLKFMIENGADLLIEDNNRCSAFIYSMQTDNLEFFKFVISKININIDFLYKAVFKATENQNFVSNTVMKYLIKNYKLDPNYVFYPTFETLLNRSRGQAELIHYLSRPIIKSGGKKVIRAIDTRLPIERKQDYEYIEQSKLINRKILGFNNKNIDKNIDKIIDKNIEKNIQKYLLTQRFSNRKQKIKNSKFKNSKFKNSKLKLKSNKNGYKKS